MNSDSDKDKPRLYHAFSAGYAGFVAWADLVDRINVFPVADGDTGTNLRISLVPLRDISTDGEQVADRLSRCATGNSGNIAAAFFREFVRAKNRADLARCSALGCAKSRQAIAKPKAGTMLDVFEALAVALKSSATKHADSLEEILAKAVRATTEQLPDLKHAGVVDAGALAMFIYFSFFFRRLNDRQLSSIPVPELFKGRIAVKDSFQADSADCFCVDVTLSTEDNPQNIRKKLATLGDSLVVVTDDTRMKIHVHTHDAVKLRNQVATMGTVEDWTHERIDMDGASRLSAAGRNRNIHIVTDGAGSLPQTLARRHGITLLESYIIYEDQARPEGLCPPEEMYQLMREGAKVTTAQASTFERHQCYASILGQFGNTLYLCVGSFYTGNYATAMAWKKNHDSDNMFHVLDSGAASGRLGLITLLTARCAEHGQDGRAVQKFAEQCCSIVWEYVFVDEFKYLVRGGRVSRTGGFLGDLLHMKPVISPMADGVRKMGTVHSQKGQVEFALKKLKASAGSYKNPVVLLQYSDNREWLERIVKPAISATVRKAEILLAPLSLTSGVHMGPGTWAIACGDDSF